MNKNLRNVMLLSLGLLTANTAMADDAIWGALIGGGAGALVGRSIGGRDGTIVGGALGAAAGVVIASDRDHHRVVQRVDYYAPAPVYVAPQTYYPAPVYYAQPVRVVPRPVIYVHGRYDRDDRRHYRGRNWDRHDHRRGWDDHRR